MTFGLSPPTSVNNMLGNWLAGIPKKELVQVRVGVCAILWAMWNVQNDFIFNKPKKPNFFAGYSHGSVLNPYVILSPTSAVF
jgi:hypothetical protein